MAKDGLYLKWRPALAEAIATFLFVFVGTGAVVVTGMLDAELTISRMTAIALANGLTITALVFATAHLSGGHMNPAVTFSAIITQKIPVSQGILYIASQLVGATLAALTLVAVITGVDIGDGAGTLGDHALGANVSVVQGLIIEIILTFVLVFVVFSAAMDPRGAGIVAPLAIGLAVIVDQFVGMPLTGASMNPARTFGPALIANSFADHWVYWVGPLVGGSLAALVHTHIFAGDKNG